VRELRGAPQRGYELGGARQVALFGSWCAVHGHTVSPHCRADLDMVACSAML
jgi:hypothetical protein